MRVFLCVSAYLGGGGGGCVAGAARGFPASSGPSSDTCAAARLTNLPGIGFVMVWARGSMQVVALWYDFKPHSHDDPLLLALHPR